MKILGISAHYHDAAAALLIDGLPVAAVEEERLSRRKHDAAFPLAAINHCLERAGLAPAELDAVVFYEKPMLKLERTLTMLLRTFPRSRRAFVRGMRNLLGGKLWVKGTIVSELGVPADRVLFTEHHQAHAAAAFLTAPTPRAAILTADGVGEWATTTAGRGERAPDGGGSARIDLVREVGFPHSLGMLYSTFTAFLGFAVNEGEYKVMGLAAYGQPRFLPEVRRLVRRTSDGAFALALEYFDFPHSDERSFSNRFVDLFGPPRDPDEPLDPVSAAGARYADIAASVQAVLEEQLVEMARALRRETGLPDLCLGGGVALNGRANARILADAGFERLFVPAAPGDGGCALGAALWADRLYFGRPDRPLPDHPFWGPAIETGALAALAAEDGLSYAEIPDDRALLRQVAAALGEGRIVGWMEGAAELGPRALGHRSILAAPHDPALRDRINHHIKYREPFRPFAPAVPAEVADRYFVLPPGGARLARFMSGVFPVRPEARAALAGVTHVDGTARVQVVDAAMTPRLHALLRAYGERTGTPVLLNTSFNLAGEPIVNRVVEGYSTFRRGDIDLLVVGSGVLEKRPRAADAAAFGPRLPEARGGARTEVLR